MFAESLAFTHFAHVAEVSFVLLILLSCPSHWVTTEFDRVCHLLPDWSGHPKVEAFYKGLAPRIKSVIASQAATCPRMLDGHRDLTTVIDENYWEFHSVQTTDSARQSTAPANSATTPPFGPSYWLSRVKLEMLQTYLDDN